MMRYNWLILNLVLLVGVGTGCRPETSRAEIPDQTPSGFDYDLVVGKPSLRLWAEAGPDSEVQTRMPAGTKLKDLGQVSDFTSRIQLTGKDYDEPWIKVRTESGQEGWVYARIADFNLATGTDTTAWMYEKRLLAYLGPEQYEQLLAYEQNFWQIDSLADFVQVYREGKQWRDKIVDAIEDHTVLVNTTELPDLFWLGEAIPGFVPQLVAEGTSYYLFTDYRQWLTQAKGTIEEEDDTFVNFCIYLFPQDSIEYFFPVWEIQTWDYGGHSLLGRGYHFGALQLMEKLGQRSAFFWPELLQWRAKLLDNLTNMEVTYWEQQSAALMELNQIIDAELSLLTKEDRIALEIRREQMENAKKYGVEFNHQSGVY